MNFVLSFFSENVCAVFFLRKKDLQDSCALQALRYANVYFAHKGASHNCYVMRLRHHHLFALYFFIDVIF